MFPSFFWIILPHSIILYQFQPFLINLNYLLLFLVVYYHPYSFSTLSNHACIYIHPFCPHFTFLAIFIYLLSYIVCFRPLPTSSTIFNTSDYFGCYQLFSTILNLPYSFSTIASCSYSYSFSSTTFNYFWPSFITSSTSSRLMTHFQHHLNSVSFQPFSALLSRLWPFSIAFHHLLLSLFMFQPYPGAPIYIQPLVIKSTWWPHRIITLYRIIRFKECIHCIGPSEFTGPLESANTLQNEE